jgi:hypothetical protein
MSNPPDLRILAFAEADQLPVSVLDRYASWRIAQAGAAVLSAVRTQAIDVPDSTLMLYIERLAVADDDAGILEGIYGVAQVVEMYRERLGLHSHYIILIMACRLNPLGVLAFERNLAQPSPLVLAAAKTLWQLLAEASLHFDQESLSIAHLPSNLRNLPIVQAMQSFYTER